TDTFRRKPTLEELRAQARAHVAALKAQPDEEPAAAARRQQAARKRAARERLERLERALAQMPELEASREAYKKGTDAKARASAQKGIAVYMPVKDAEKKEGKGEDPYQPRKSDKPGMAAWRVRMGTEAAKVLYRLRASTAELINAGCRNRGFYQVRVRGVAKV